MNLLLSDEAEEYIIFILNSVSMSEFTNFIAAIDRKANWYEELCCCYFEQANEYEYYRFETFEGEKNNGQFTLIIPLPNLRYFRERLTSVFLLYEIDLLEEKQHTKDSVSPLRNTVNQKSSLFSSAPDTSLATALL